MDKSVSVLLRQFVGILAGFIVNISVQDHLRAIAFGALHFDERCRGRHDNHSFCAEGFCRVGNALCMVACRGGDQAFAALLLRQGTDLIVGAAELVSSCHLHIFRFQVNFVAGLCAEIVAVDQLGVLRHFFYCFRRFFKFFQGQHNFSPLLLDVEKRVYEFIGIKFLQIVNALSYPYIFHRNVKLRFDCHRNSAFCCSVQFR